MSLPTLQPESSVVLKLEPLLPSTFAAFGSVIASPWPQTLTSYPHSIPDSIYSAQQPTAVSANQSTALKTSPIGPLTNTYDKAHPNPRGTGLMSIFSSFPRKNIYSSSDTATQKRQVKLKVGILERHPYTTQTFCPFNYSETTAGKEHDQTYMLIIVAPTLTESTSKPANPPDLNRVRAFIAPLNRSGQSSMAVTYAPGTWHAPMVVLGNCRVDFLVTQFANGVPNDDCQEVLIGSGPDPPLLSDLELKMRSSKSSSDRVIEVDLSPLKLSGVSRSSKL